MNGIRIDDIEDFEAIYRDDPGRALGLIFKAQLVTNNRISDIENHCRCRLEACRKENDEKLTKNKIKNLAAQAGGGMVGGFAAAWVYIKTVLGAGQ